MDFIIHLEAVEGLSKNTCQSYQNDLQMFAVFVKTRRQGLVHASSQLISDYLFQRAAEGAKPATSSRIQSSLKRFYDYLIVERQIETNPVARLKRPKMNRKIPHGLSEESVANSFNSLPTA